MSNYPLTQCILCENVYNIEGSIVVYYVVVGRLVTHS